MENLPEYILKGRASTEGVVLGCLYNDILLAKEYELTQDMFITKEGMLLFAIIKKLLNKNVMTVCDTDIRLNCSDEIITEYKELGGFKAIEILKKSVDVKNFESYLDDLQKKNLYIEFYNDGLDLQKTIKVETKTKTVMISWLDLFEKMTAEECIQFKTSRETNYQKITLDNTIIENTSGIDSDFLENLKRGDSLGVLFDYVGDTPLMPYLSKKILGFNKKTLNVIAAPSNIGKSTILLNMVLSFADKQQKGLIITNEQSINDLQISFVVYILNNVLKNHKINKRKLKSGKLTDEETVSAEEAIKIYNEKFAPHLILISMADHDITQVEKLIRKYKLSQDIDYFCIDTLKLDFNSNTDAGYKELIKDSRALYKLARQFNLMALATMQTALSFAGELIPGMNQLSNSKAVAEILENLIMIRPLYPQFELNKSSSYYISPYKIIKQNGKWTKEPYELDENSSYRVCFICKARSCETFVDSQEAIILKFDGYSNTVKEVAMCNPKAGNINNQFNKKRG